MSARWPVRLKRPLIGPPLESVHHIVFKRQNALGRVFAFTGHTIDDVINDPSARIRVRGFFKMHKAVERHSEIVDLERQWNA